MNKTININLGGFFFHIDETAFQKLNRYLDAISRSLNDDPQGKNEIIADIEARISELLSERIKDARQVVNEADIDEVIAIMGQPEDYAEAEEAYAETSSSYTRRKTTSKKLFRDGDDKFLGGVCSGLGHYLGIDAIWIRLAFILLTASGFSPLAYIILWILLPEAKSTAEKLQMEGEPVNIDNIEKKIRNEFETLSLKLKDGANELTEKISSADYEKLRSQTKSGFQDFLDTLGKILSAVFKVFGKFIGVILVFAAGVTLISLLFGLFSVGSLEILNFDNDMIHYPPFFYGSSVPTWLLTTFLFILIGIPFLALFILGLRILSPSIKRLSTVASLSLLGIWLVALLGVAFSGIEYATSRAQDGTKVTKEAITYNAAQPLRIAVKNDDDIYYQHNLRRRDNSVEVIVNDQKMKYSNDIKIDVEKSETGTAYLEIKKEAEGRKRINAVENAEKLIYKFKIGENRILFDAYFLSEIKNMWKDEEIRLTVFIPEGTTVYFENSSKKFLYHIDNTEDIYDSNMANHHFKMTSKGFECMDCDDKEDHNNDWNSNDDNDSNNDNDVSFLFNSTINDAKAELIINKSTTKRELQKLANWFKNKKNIDLDFSESEFYDDGKIKNYLLKVNCNDGFSGKTEKIISINNGEHGFVRNYNEDGSVAFRIW
ncbi:phage shock protein C (PspC) family protein [Tenacibaculum adriaticum]|uniref:Phage shock protein C (PspC) family protein n=1 Tax=Tenacibaculum adriaticum TaxID=413713 RepID=A0A5S5DR48_9FLAO|nr:PspC domain-containing protein [Tenacibaculum adriaticum]TYP98215.1 phage shock protein C (PspC) family protein [Tenacibaculum adriaticum]